MSAEEATVVDVLEGGLAALFRRADARYDASLGLFASKDFLASGRVAEKVAELQNILVADTYGGVDAVAWARDAYNARRLAMVCRHQASDWSLTMNLITYNLITLQLLLLRIVPWHYSID